MARKLALIIGNSQYQDACLAKLAAPDVDVRALADVLSTPGIGAFDEVTQLLNEGLATVRRTIAQFFDLKHRDDLLFLYFSGHGVRDEQGHLHLAVRDTERAVIAGTAIEASFITGRMDRSASKRLVLVLDCCHSGAFGYGTKAAQGATVGTATAFEGTGRGRVVLTATDSTQYAWDGDQVLGEFENSLFTHYMIEGLRTGAADRDEDGLITIDELYDYVYDHVLNETPRQTPGKWAYGQQGEIVIAQNAAANRATLPPEIQEAVGSTLPSVRLEAVRQLDSILRGRHALRASAARDVLKRLAEDDSRRVAAAAIAILNAFERGGHPVQPEVLARGIQIEKQNERERERAAEEARRIEEERARLEDAERRIRELRQRIGTLIARANAETSHGNAIALLNEALGLDPEHGEVKELLEDRHRLRQNEEAAKAQQEAERLEAQRAAELARQEAERERRALDEILARAAKRQRRRDSAAALGLIDDVLARDSQHAEALALRAQIERAIEDRAAHPPAGFSLRATVSTANVWLRTKGIYPNTFRISSALILVAATAIGMWGGRADPRPAVTPAPTSSSPAPIQPPPTDVALEPEKPALPAPPPAPTRNEVVVSAESAARRQLEAGKPGEALRSLRPGLAVDPTDAGLQELLLRIEADAQSRVSIAENAADKAGSVATASPAFADAKRFQKEGERLRDQGRHEAAIRRYWDATRLFGEAAATKQAPPTPEATAPVSAAVAAASAAVERVRQRYEAGFTNRNIEELKAVWPSMPRAVQKTLSDHFRDARSVALDLQCRPPVFTDLERGQGGRRATAVLSCDEKRQVLSPFGGVRRHTMETATLYLRAEGQAWIIINVASQLFKQ